MDKPTSVEEKAGSYSVALGTNLRPRSHHASGIMLASAVPATNLSVSLVQARVLVRFDTCMNILLAMNNVAVEGIAP